MAALDLASNDHAELEALAHRAWATDPGLAVHAAGLAGHHAAHAGVPARRCPFARDDLAAPWLWYHGVARAAQAERRRAGAGDLFGRPA